VLRVMCQCLEDALVADSLDIMDDAVLPDLSFCVLCLLSVARKEGEKKAGVKLPNGRPVMRRFFFERGGSNTNVSCSRPRAQISSSSNYYVISTSLWLMTRGNSDMYFESEILVGRSWTMRSLVDARSGSRIKFMTDHVHNNLLLSRIAQKREESQSTG
jgi:hypothetical protein